MSWKKVTPASKITLKYMRIANLLQQAMEPYVKMHVESLERVVKVRNALETRRNKDTVPTRD